MDKVTLKDEILVFIDRWFKDVEDGDTFIKPFDTTGTGILCWEYYINKKGEASLFEGRNLRLIEFEEFISVDDSDKNSINQATIAIAKRLLKSR